MKQLIFSFKEKFIKATLVERRDSVFNVLTGGSIELAPGTIEAGAIKNYEDVKERLRDLIGGISAAKSHHIIVLLSEEASFLKVLATTDEKDLLEKPEVQEKIPYPAKSSFTTLRLLRNKNIQLVATPKDLISNYQKLFKDIGLEISSIIPEPVIFLPFLQKATKPILVISSAEDSILFTVIFESGVYFSTTKHFNETTLNKNKLIAWVKEILERQIKTFSPTLDFEALVSGQYEEEILEILKEGGFIAQSLNIRFGKVSPQIDDVGRYKKLIIAAGLDKQIPGFHIKDVRKIKTGVVIQTSILPKINWRLLLVFLGALLIILGLIWFTPKILDTVFPTKKQDITSTPVSTPTPIATPSATPSAKKDISPEATKAAEKEPPKPVLKRSSLKIEVLNGNGVPGTAKDAEEFLTSKGYKVISIGNAPNYNFAKTEIRLKKSKAGYLALLTKDLSTRYTIVKGTSLKESSSFDAQVIIGNQ